MLVQIDNLEIIIDRDREKQHCHHYPKTPKNMRYGDESVFHSSRIVEGARTIEYWQKHQKASIKSPPGRLWHQKPTH